MKIVATTSLPAVDRPNADRWNAARSRQYLQETSVSGQGVVIVVLSKGGGVSEEQFSRWWWGLIKYFYHLLL